MPPLQTTAPSLKTPNQTVVHLYGNEWMWQLSVQHDCTDMGLTAKKRQNKGPCAEEFYALQIFQHLNIIEGEI